MMTSPKISVVMPVWNGEKYLREAVDGILAQTFSDFELLTLDDGSTDSTPEILASYRDRRVRIVRLDHLGLVEVLRYGMAQARAEWVTRHDADDISHPLRFEKQWRAIHRRPSAVLTYTAFERIGELAHMQVPGHFPRSRALVAMKLCYLNPLVQSTLLFRRAAYEQVGGYDPREIRAEDYSLLGKLVEAGDCIGLAEPLLRYRVHAASDSRTKAALVRQYATEIAIRHCCQFMQLSSEEGKQAFEILTTAPQKRTWSEWLWFLQHCVPRLRWKSAELYAWLGSQTVQVLLSKPRRTKPEMV